MPLGRLRIAFSLIVAAAAEPALGEHAEHAPGVVASITRVVAAPAPGAPASLRSQCIEVVQSGVDLMRSGVDGAFEFGLFNDARLTVRVDRLDLLNSDSFTAAGRLDDGGWFVMAQVEDALAANFWTAEGKRFEVRRRADGSHVASEPDPSGFEPCAGGIELRFDDVGLPEVASGIPCSNVIDVLIVYTELARTTAGGEAAIRAIAHAAVASANLMYSNSGVNALLRPVHIAEVVYQESGNFALDLDRLRLPSDGHMDIVHALRDEFGADLVSLLVGTVSGTCGTAYVMTNPSPSFANLAFSVTRHVCAVGDMTFAHEIGHNLGCQHQHNQPGSGAFPYSFGHTFVGVSGQAWRTVMAVNPGTHIPFFSNPDVLYDGAATGVPLDQPDPAHCTLSINTTAEIVAAFRTSTARDCNRNGIDDACDLASGASADTNANGIPDECDGPLCAVDEMIEVAPIDSLSTDQFAASVALGSERFIAGADFNDEAGSNAGAAYVFRRATGSASGLGTWELEAKLIGLDTAPFEHFGKSVAITTDDEWAIVGAFRDTTAISDVGAAYIFKRDGTTWSQQAKLVAPTPAQQDWLGWSVAFARDPEGELHALAGAPQDDEADLNAGAVHAYAIVDDAWTHQAILAADDAKPNDRFGTSISATSTGHVIVGAPLADHGGEQSGAAYVFALNKGAWIQEARLLAPDAAAGDQFGYSVGIDGDRAVVGAPRADAAGNDSGAAYVFVRAAGTWTLEAKLTAADAAAEDRFGWSVSMAGNRILVGAPLDAHLGSASGSAYVFAMTSDGWFQQAKITEAGGGAPFDQFGASVSIGPDALAAAIGAPLADRSTAIDGGTMFIASIDTDQPDCNGNSIADDCDISNGLSLDRNGNGVPDECETRPCPADVAGNDGVVDVADLLAVINAWGDCPPPCPDSRGASCAADINGDCAVSIHDLLLVLDGWGDC